MATQITSFPELTTTERNALTSVPSGTVILNSSTNQLEVWNGTIWVSQTGNLQSSAFAVFASSQVTTIDVGNSSPTFGTPTNSPGFTFTPTITGTYKVYCSLPLQSQANAENAYARIFNTSGGATLLQESQGTIYSQGGAPEIGSILIQSTYILTAGTAYVFDFQTKVGSSISYVRGDLSPFYIFAEGIALNGTLNTTGSSYDIFSSSQVNTDSSSVTSSYPTFTTFDNSPAFTFTPSITGKYKVYSSVPIYQISPNQNANIRIFNTSGGAVLLQESQAYTGAANIVSNNDQSSLYTQSVYELTAGVQYVFDIQGAITGGSGARIIGSTVPFYMFAEGIGLNNNSCQFPVNMKVTGAGSWSANNPIILSSVQWDTNSGYNTSNGQYAVPYDGYYLVGWIANATTSTKQVGIYVNGVQQELIDNGFAADPGAVGTSTTVKVKKGDIITWIANIGFSANVTTQWISSTTLAQGLTGPQGSSGGSAFAFFASTQVTTFSGVISSVLPTWTTFDNSPALTFTPTISGIYKVYSSVCVEQGTNSVPANVRIFNTSGGATLLQESQADTNMSISYLASFPVQSTYVLNAGTTYVFDIQAANFGGAGSIQTRGDIAPFYMFAEGISLSPVLASPVGVVTTKFGVDPTTTSTLAVTSGSPIAFPYTYFDTTSSYNAGSGEYTAPVAGYYDIQITSAYAVSSQMDLFAVVNGTTVAGRITMNYSGSLTASGSTQIFLNYGDVLTIQSDITNSFTYAALTSSPASGYIPTVTVSLRPPTPAVTSRIVRSLTTGTSGSTFSTTLTPILDSGGVNPLTATINSSGGDVEVGLMNDGTGNTSYISIDQTPTDAGCTIQIFRDATLIYSDFYYKQNNVTIEIAALPPNMFRFIDTPPPGNHTYTVSIVAQNNPRTTNTVISTILYARPLA